ncbi:4167_t:CDS:1, partial [Entrophospora sp. SA101]
MWKRTYWIDREPYGGTGFNKAGTPILPPYKPEEPEVQCSSSSANDIQ